MNTITITLPLPRNGLTPNRAAQGGHRMMLAKGARADGFKCAYAALNRRNPPRWAKASATITRYGPTKQHPDRDNLIASLKHYIDGVADAGIVANDKGLSFAEPVFAVDKADPRIEITVAEIGGGK
jgi:hypothetical protein